MQSSGIGEIPIGKIIGTLDASGNLVMAGDRPTETPLGARNCVSESTQGNQPPKASETRGI
jgi:hypothetical protein